MKLFATTLAALCLFVFVGCDTETETPPTPDTTIVEANTKVEANVEGMDCTGCSGSIEAAVGKIAGVTGCSADVASGDVVVALADDADAEAKKAEVEKVIAELQEGKFKVKTIAVSTKAADEAQTPAEEPAAYPEVSEPSKAPAKEEPAAEELGVDEQAGTEPAEEAFVFTTYKVTGMDCSGCSGEIVSALKQVPGVKTVEADHQAGTVHVAFDDNIDDKSKMVKEVKAQIAGLSDGKYTVNY